MIDFKAARQGLTEKYKQTMEHLDTTEKLFSSLDIITSSDTLATMVEQPAPKKKAKVKKKPKAAAGTPSVRKVVLDFIATDFACITKIAHGTKLGVEQIRGVLNAKDLKERLEKRTAGEGKLMEYKFKG